MDEISLAHAAWVQANERLVALAAQSAAAEARLSAEKATEEASNHYKLLVDRLMQQRL
ncbi:MAG: hypothetical protein JWQ90_1697 [Hydrocarboniphaga sp.]|nr:hypothetical protein [Hydrocarboniphaga sp.]